MSLFRSTFSFEKDRIIGIPCQIWAELWVPLKKYAGHYFGKMRQKLPRRAKGLQRLSDDFVAI